jgi:2-(1,2-epoxy-1,2-dihydrophenyl)acetyl-CoA isomerase
MATVLFTIEEGVGVITLNRPEKFNSFNREMALSFQHTLNALAADNTVRCVYITGNGKAFCAGQDLGELVGENPPGFEVILKEHYNPVVRSIRTMDKPVVAAVNGVAAGAGANIALCCDVVVAARSASFIQAFSKIGLIPDSGGTFTLPRLIGWQKASALMMMGDKVSAAEAEQMGMLYKVFDDDSFTAESRKIATTLSRMPTRGLAYTKQALHASALNNLDQQLALEDKLQYAAAHTNDYREGISAFLEKRMPVFTGE